MLFGLAPRLGMRRVLVSAQVAFSVVLVALAGLFAHSMAELRSVDLGFRHQDVLAFEVEKGMGPALERLERLPGVALVSYAFPGPFLAGTSNANVRVAGTETNANSWTSVHRVGPRYFETIGATLAAGRDIERTDTAKSRPVTVVNEAFLREYLRGERLPLDRLVSQGGSPDMAIVGVVRDIVHEGLRSKPVPTVYVPWAQSPTICAPTFVVRGNVRPETIRRFG